MGDGRWEMAWTARRGFPAVLVASQRGFQKSGDVPGLRHGNAPQRIHTSTSSSGQACDAVSHATGASQVNRVRGNGCACLAMQNWDRPSRSLSRRFSLYWDSKVF